MPDPTHILETADYDAVREAVGADETILPDAVLDEFPFRDYAEALIMEAVPGWAAIVTTGTGNDFIFLKTAAAYMLAMVIALRFRMSIQYGHGFSFGGYSEAAKMVNWDAVIAQLREWIKEALSGISTFELVRPTLVLISGPSSSRANVPTVWDTWVDMVTPRIVDWLIDLETAV